MTPDTMCKTKQENGKTTKIRKSFYLPELNDDGDPILPSLDPPDEYPKRHASRESLDRYSPSRTKMPIIYPPRNSSYSTSKEKKEKKEKSLSFAGFEFFSLQQLDEREEEEATNQEIESLMDEKKKEVNKVTKEQIKIFAQKYKDVKDEKSHNNPQPWYRELLNHSQTPHLILMVGVVVVASRLFPDSSKLTKESSTVIRFIYVSSVSTVFGSQFWMTFINGLALFFSVPRHVFSQVQFVLFPLYFLLNAGLTFISIIAYTQHYPSHLWDTHQTIQAATLVGGFLCNLLIRLYLAPALTNLITIKMAIEKEAGMGAEVANTGPGTLKKCPHYMRLYRAFRRVHKYIAIGNMIAMAATCFHMYYLSIKLCSNENNHISM